MKKATPCTKRCCRGIPFLLILTASCLIASCGSSGPSVLPDTGSPDTGSTDAGSSDAGSSDAGSQLDLEIQKKLVSAVKSKMKLSKAPGVIAGVWTPQGSWEGTFGKADIVTMNPPVVTDRFRLGSVTKIFVGTSILQLVEEQKLGLEDNVKKFLPDIALQYADIMAVRQLLNHTAGTYDFQYDQSYIEMVTNDPAYQWTPLQLVNLAVNHPPDFMPGEKYSYSNTNYILLGMIVEKVTGGSIASFIKLGIVDRLGLKSTYFAEGTEWYGDHMHGYVDKSLTEPLWDVTDRSASSSWAAGAMVSTIRDLDLFIKAVANGDLLNAETQKVRMNCQETGGMYNKLKVSYCMGLFKYRDLLGHNGDTLGFQSSVWYWPQKGITVAIGQNKNLVLFGNTEEIAMEFFNILVPGFSD